MYVFAIVDWFDVLFVTTMDRVTHTQG